MADAAACRILVVAATTAQAQQFVQRVMAVSTSGPAHAAPASAHPPAPTHASDTASSSIPWTIANKYYTADVHFETREYGAFAGHHASAVPAVVYVWRRGDPYREHIPALADKLRHCDPEVALAVRCGRADHAQRHEHEHELHEDEDADEDEEDGLDEFVAAHGFEYVDGDRAGRRPTRDGGGFDDEDSAGVPGLPRVVDALSTIMWPSLVHAGAPAPAPARAQKSRMLREVEELERWLAEADAGRRGADDAEAWGAPGSSGDGSEAGLGFEDDFAEFVGAPVRVAYDGDGDGDGDGERQHAMHTGASYRSLASADDVFGAADDGDDDADADLPSRAEIEETSRRIFGRGFGAALGVPDAVRAGSRARSETAFASEAAHARAHAAATDEDAHADVDEDAHADVDEDAHADVPYRPLDDDAFSVDEEADDFEFGAFDLSRVLGALQGMKEEIAGMQDEDERRRAAARVALGLVYGLRKEDERQREADAM